MATAWKASEGGVRMKCVYEIALERAGDVPEYEICGILYFVVTSAAEAQGPEEAGPRMAATLCGSCASSSALKNASPESRFESST